MVTASVRSNLATLMGVRGKDVLYVPGISAASSSLAGGDLLPINRAASDSPLSRSRYRNRLFPFVGAAGDRLCSQYRVWISGDRKKVPAIRSKRNFIVPYIMEVDERLPDNPDVCRELFGGGGTLFVGQISRHKGRGSSRPSFRRGRGEVSRCEAAPGRRRERMNSARNCSGKWRLRDWRAG